MSKHDPRVREHCRELYEQHGAAYASEHTGVAERTIRRWAIQNDWPRRMAVVRGWGENQPIAKRAAVQGWSTRRRRAADEFGETAMLALAKLQAELTKTRPRQIQGLAMAACWLVGKAEELSAAVAGGGGDYRDVPAEVKVAHLVELVDVITERAGGDG